MAANTAMRTAAPLIEPPMMAPLLVVPLPVPVEGALPPPVVSPEAPSGDVEPPVAPGDSEVEEDVVVEEEDDDDDDDDEDEVCELEGDVAPEDVCGSVPDPLEGFPLGFAVASGGCDPIEVGSGRETGNAVSGTDVSSNTRLAMPSADVATEVPKEDAVPQPNWKYPPANSFL